jgi:hypothetical protein
MAYGQRFGRYGRFLLSWSWFKVSGHCGYCILGLKFLLVSLSNVVSISHHLGTMGEWAITVVRDLFRVAQGHRSKFSLDVLAFSNVLWKTTSQQTVFVLIFHKFCLTFIHFDFWYLVNLNDNSLNVFLLHEYNPHTLPCEIWTLCLYKLEWSNGFSVQKTNVIMLNDINLRNKLLSGRASVKQLLGSASALCLCIRL